MDRRQFLALGAGAALAQSGERTAVYRHIYANIDARVERLQEYIRQPLIDTKNGGIKECAELTRQYDVLIDGGEVRMSKEAIQEVPRRLRPHAALDGGGDPPAGTPR